MVGLRDVSYNYYHRSFILFFLFGSRIRLGVGWVFGSGCIILYFMYSVFYDRLDCL